MEFSGNMMKRDLKAMGMELDARMKESCAGKWQRAGWKGKEARVVMAG